MTPCITGNFPGALPTGALCYAACLLMLPSCLNFPAFPIFSLPCLPSCLSGGFLPTPASSPLQPSQGKRPLPPHRDVFPSCSHLSSASKVPFSCNTRWGGSPPAPQRCGGPGQPTSSLSAQPPGLWGRVQQSSTGTIKYRSPFLKRCQLLYQHPAQVSSSGCLRPWRPISQQRRNE